MGQTFASRAELRGAGIHLPPQSGISGTGREGADSIVLSGGYGDDKDFGDYVFYTGHGGRDRQSGRQIADQSSEATGNAGLITSEVAGLPVRVTRGADPSSPFAPVSGYRYAGLFTVTSHWDEIGRDGFRVIRFRLDRLAEQDADPVAAPLEPDPAFATTTVSRRVRDSATARAIKALYEERCQLCGTAVPGTGGRSYAEGAHVRPLGRPHLGPDTASNILCLCPNHHVQLDIGGMYITDSLTVVDGDNRVLGTLTFAPGHELAIANAIYHRENCR